MVVIVSVVMPVIMVMPIQRQRALGACAKEGAVFRRIRNVFRCPFATDMAIQAQHPIRGGHHHMQVMTDHQHGKVHFGADLFDLAIKRGSTGLIEALRGFIQDQDVGITQQCPRQQHPLKLPAR